MQKHIREFVDSIEPGEYFSILAYLPQSTDTDKCFTSMRKQFLSYRNLATTAAYGPRYLHSSGQLHKGGQNNGVYLIITADHPNDISIPGKPFTFNQLNRAQALGDYEVLKKHNRRVLRVHLEKDTELGLARLQSIISEILATKSN